MRINPRHPAMPVLLLLLLTAVASCADPAAGADEQRDRRMLENRRLAWAAWHNDVSGVQTALKAGADPNARFPLWQYLDFQAEAPPALTPQNTALKDGYGKQELVPILFAAGPETVTVLVGAGADVEARDSNGDTPLIFYAADRQLELDPNSDIGDHRGCDVAMMTALLQAGAKADARNHDGDTALHLIHNCLSNSGPAFDNHRDVEAGIRLLVRHGADVNAKNNAGKTVLQVTADSWGEGYTYGTAINATLKKLGARSPNASPKRASRKARSRKQR